MQEIITECQKSIHASLTMAVLLTICALIFISRISQPGYCLTVQAIFRKKAGKYLANHVIETKHVETELQCSMLCLAHGSCVSVNYEPTGAVKGRCELINSTFQDTSDNDGNTRNTNLFCVIKKVRKIHKQLL